MCTFLLSKLSIIARDCSRKHSLIWTVCNTLPFNISSFKNEVRDFKAVQVHQTQFIGNQWLWGRLEVLMQPNIRRVLFDHTGPLDICQAFFCVYGYGVTFFHPRPALHCNRHHLLFAAAHSSAFLCCSERCELLLARLVAALVHSDTMPCTLTHRCLKFVPGALYGVTVV